MSIFPFVHGRAEGNKGVIVRLYNPRRAIAEEFCPIDRLYLKVRRDVRFLP